MSTPWKERELIIGKWHSSNIALTTKAPIQTRPGVSVVRSDQRESGGSCPCLPSRQSHSSSCSALHLIRSCLTAPSSNTGTLPFVRSVLCSFPPRPGANGQTSRSGEKPRHVTLTQGGRQRKGEGGEQGFRLSVPPSILLLVSFVLPRTTISQIHTYSTTTTHSYENEMKNLR